MIRTILLSLIFLFVASCATSRSFESRGFASWYGRDFQGRRTASGEKFDRHALTAAHRTLAFGTLVRVTSVATGASVVVRVNDRGPYAYDRVIDLSYEAARRIGIVSLGHAEVLLERP